MTIQETPITGCYELTPKCFEDDRGHFFESFNAELFASLTGNNTQFVQDNQSYSTRGVLRGLHFQKGRDAQAKLVRVIQGEVLDVAVDLRQNSPSYGKIHRARLSGQNQKQLFVPRAAPMAL